MPDNQPLSPWVWHYRSTNFKTRKGRMKVCRDETPQGMN